MPILPMISCVQQEVILNQAYNVAGELDLNDVPPECRLFRYSVDDNPFDLDSEHDEFESLMHRLYCQGLRALTIS